MAWQLMMAWDLLGNWSQELLRLRLSTKLSTQQIQEFLPPYPGDAPLPLPDLEKLYEKVDLAATRIAEVAPPVLPEGAGSNNWVVAGSRTESGKPLLANDPHLGLTAPAVWYFAHLDAPGLKAIGATLPSIPAIVLGRNERIAWVFTNTGPDTQDLFIVVGRRGSLALFENGHADQRRGQARAGAASLRAVSDLADPDRSVFMHSTGQSGNRLSSWYGNFAKAWVRVEYVPMTMQHAEIEKGAVGRLTLAPGN